MRAPVRVAKADHHGSAPFLVLSCPLAEMQSHVLVTGFLKCVSHGHFASCSHLDLASMAAASQVCRHFHRARWEHMDLSAHPDVPMSAFSKLMQRLPMRLTVPRLTAMPALPTLVLELFQGTVLNLRNCRLPPGGLDVLLAQHKVRRWSWLLKSSSNQEDSLFSPWQRFAV